MCASHSFHWFSLRSSSRPVSIAACNDVGNIEAKRFNKQRFTVLRRDVPASPRDATKSVTPLAREKTPSTP